MLIGFVLISKHMKGDNSFNNFVLIEQQHNIQKVYGDNETNMNSNANVHNMQPQILSYTKNVKIFKSNLLRLSYIGIVVFSKLINNLMNS